MCLLGAASISLSAQVKPTKVKDSVNSENIAHSPEIQEPQKTFEEKYFEVQKMVEAQRKQISLLQDSIKIVSEEKASLEKKKENADKHAEKVEKSLISMASNFLYLPYEAYGVQEIAIKAFESVQDPQLKEKYNQRYVLLTNYQKHLREFKTYLEKVQKACNGVFQATAIEFIDTNDPSVSPELILKKQPFYQEYIKYNGYEETFIGSLIQKTISILKSHTKQNRANLKGTLSIIQSIETSEEIDSVPKLIVAIDKRLKTVENL